MSSWVTATWDYAASAENELSFKAGDAIQLVFKHNDDWWEGSCHGQVGFFPANRVKEQAPDADVEAAAAAADAETSAASSPSQQQPHAVTRDSSKRQGIVTSALFHGVEDGIAAAASEEEEMKENPFEDGAQPSAEQSVPSTQASSISNTLHPHELPRLAAPANPKIVHGKPTLTMHTPMGSTSSLHSASASSVSSASHHAQNATLPHHPSATQGTAAKEGESNLQSIAESDPFDDFTFGVAPAVPRPAPSQPPPSARPPPSPLQKGGQASQSSLFLGAGGDPIGLTFNVMPSGWRKALTKEGRPFFFEPARMLTMWETPQMENEPLPAMPHPYWRQAKSPDGRIYYFNKFTKQSVWVRPDEADSIAEADMTVTSDRPGTAGSKSKTLSTSNSVSTLDSISSTSSALAKLSDLDAQHLASFDAQQHTLTNPIGSYAMQRRYLKPIKSDVGRCQLLLQPAYAVILPEESPDQPLVLRLEGMDCGRGRNMEEMEGVQRPSILSLRKEKKEFLFAPQSGRTDEAREIALAFARAISSKRQPVTAASAVSLASNTALSGAAAAAPGGGGNNASTGLSKAVSTSHISPAGSQPPLAKRPSLTVSASGNTVAALAAPSSPTGSRSQPFVAPATQPSHDDVQTTNASTNAAAAAASVPKAPHSPLESIPSMDRIHQATHKLSAQSAAIHASIKDPRAATIAHMGAPSGQQIAKGRLDHAQTSRPVSRKGKLDDDESKRTIKTRLKGFFSNRPPIDQLRKSGILLKDVIFGGDLQAQFQRAGHCVPPFVLNCIETVERRGLDSVGIYRLSGNASGIQKIKQIVNDREGSIDFDAEDQFIDINIVTGSLKLFFRELTDPMMMFDLYPKFIAAAKNEDYNGRLLEIKHTLQKLPIAHYATLHRLIQHLVKVASQSGENKMEPVNLAIVFGPTLMRPREESMDAVMNTGPQNSVIENLIVQCDWFFDGDKVQVETDA